jgi:hypothetical protein
MRYTTERYNLYRRTQLSLIYVLVKVLTKKFIKDGASQFQKLRVSLRKFHEIITVRLYYHKCCARWVQKILMGVHKTQRMASDFVEFVQQGTKVTSEVY